MNGVPPSPGSILSLPKCNSLIYYGSSASVGGSASIEAAVAIYSQFNNIIIGKQNGGDITNLKSILFGTRSVNPVIKWFGYTSLGQVPVDASQNITGATNATPIVIAHIGHGLITNDLVNISGVVGNTGANNIPGSGVWAITKIDNDHYSLNGSVGNGVYTGGTGKAWTYPLWLASMNQWLTDIPVPNKLNGILIDTAGPDYGLSTRTNLNLAITAIHAAGYNAFVNGFEIDKVLGTLDGQAVPVLGTNATYPDYFLIESYWKANNAQTLEVYEHRIGRALIAQAAQNATGLLTGSHLTPVIMVGSGALDNISNQDWLNITDELSFYGINNFGIGPSDYGSSSHDYFLTNIVNKLQ